jgi:16S rRNA (cytosine1402-N4)-methyltransferase
VRGTWLDGTLGAGGYARGLLEAGADQVIGVDRDPLAIAMARDWGAPYGDRLRLVQDNFAAMDTHAEALDGVVLDLGVSSMQLDQATRGFSFMRDGPLDMRMSQEGPSAADLVNTAAEAQLADILYLYGEERASRRIARAILRARETAPIETTAQLAAIVERCLPRAQTRRATGGRHLSFHRGPDRETLLAEPRGRAGRRQPSRPRDASRGTAIHAQDPKGHRAR